jgi:D-alanine-D-alanine ligase
VFPIGAKVNRPGRLKFPLIVKSLWEDASLGIAQASIVDTDEKLAERVAFIHKRLNTPAIAEEFIDGREIYVGCLGNDRIQVLPVWELSFSNLADGAHAIATEKVKHDPIYQEKRGILQGPAENLPTNVVTKIRTLAKRICHTLELDGYCRIDFRLSKDNVPYFIEANPNPEIASSQEYAQAALHAGISYEDLLNKIVAFGLKRAGVDI